MSFAERKIETIADTHRAFNELNTDSIQYKPYHNQLAKYRFPEFMREVVSRMLSEFAIQSLTIDERSPFSRFKNILIHDGSAYAIKSDLKKIYPGKFKKQAPAAVQLHTTMGLREDEVLSVTLAAFNEADDHSAASWFFCTPILLKKMHRNAMLIVNVNYLLRPLIHESLFAMLNIV